MQRRYKLAAAFGCDKEQAAGGEIPLGFAFSVPVPFEPGRIITNPIVQRVATSANRLLAPGETFCESGGMRLMSAERVSAPACGIIGFHAATLAQVNLAVIRQLVALIKQPLPVWRNGRRTGLKILGP